MDYLERGRPGYLRATLALFAGAFVTFALLYVMQPLLPALSRQYGVDPAASSLAVSMTTGALAVAMLFVPGLSDRWGRKRVMQTAILAASLVCLLVAGAPSFPLLLVLRVVQGVALAGFPAIAMTYVTEEFSPGSQGQAMGLYVSGTTLGGMVGRILTGALTDLWGWRAAVVWMGVLCLAISAWFIFALPRPRHFSPQPLPLADLARRLTAAAREPAAIGLYAAAFLLMGGFVSVYNYLTYQLLAPPYRLSQTWTSLIFLVYLAGTVSSAWMGRWGDQVGKARAMIASTLLGLAGIALTLLTPLGGKILGLAIFTFGFFGAHSTASSWVPRLVGAWRAQASSLYLLCYYAGSSVVGTVGGWCWIAGGWPTLVALVGMLYGLVLPITAYTHRHTSARQVRGAA